MLLLVSVACVLLVLLFLMFQYHVKLGVEPDEVIVQHPDPVHQGNEGLAGLAGHGLDLHGHPLPNIEYEVAQTERSYDGKAICVDHLYEILSHALVLPGVGLAVRPADPVQVRPDVERGADQGVDPDHVRVHGLDSVVQGFDYAAELLDITGDGCQDEF